MADTVAVLGGNGFIGEAILRSLRSKDTNAIALVREAGADAARLRQSILSWRDAPEVTKAIDEHGIDCLVMAAGRASVAESLVDPRGDFLASVDLSSRMLEAARRASRPPHVLLLSSAAVYGQPESFPVPEDCRTAPLSPYGHHKSMVERLGKTYSDTFGLSVSVMRIFSVVGPAQRRLLPFELWSQSVRPGVAIELRGTGNESRDYLHVDDLASAVCGIASAGGPEGDYRIFNTASGTETTVLDIARYFRDANAQGRPIVCRGKPSGADPERWCADVSRLRLALPSWTPRSLNDALADCAREWGSTVS